MTPITGFSDDSAIFQANLAVLKRRFPALYNLVSQHEPVFDGEVVTGANGMANLRYRLENGANFLAYDNENPMESVGVHLNIVPEDATGVAVFIGIGLGYGPLVVSQKRPDLVKIVIVEPSLDVFCLALRSVDLRQLLESPKLHLYIGHVDFQRMELELAREVSISDTYLLKHQPSFTWLPDLYGEVDKQVFQLLNKINTMGSTTRSFGRLFVKNRLANLTNIRFATNTDVLKDVFNGLPALLVAAGPSLDMSIPDIRRAKGRCIIFAVDSALPTLLKHDIVPDFISSLDMETPNFEKVTLFLGERFAGSLAITIKVSPFIPKRFSAKHIFYAFNEDLPHMWMVKQLGIKHLLPPLLSVAHLSMGLAHLMGASPIVLVGQDLSYTKAVGSDHASGVIFHEKGLPKDKEIFYVKSLAGDEVPTDRGLLSLKQQFEEIVAASPVPVINATAMGAHIEGTEVMPLSDVIERFMTQPVNVNELIEDAISKHKPWQNSQIANYAARSLQTSKEVLGKVEKAQRMLHKAIKEIEGLIRKGVRAFSLKELPQRLQEELIKLDTLNNQTDGYTEFWNQVLELTYDMLKENDAKKVRNERIKDEQGYLPWLKAEMQRLLEVQTKRIDVLSEYNALLERLINRLNEEDRLLKAISKAKDVQKIFELRSELAKLYVDSDDLQLALGVLEELLQINSKHPEVQLLLGYVRAGLLDFERATGHFETALRIAPELGVRVDELRERAASPWLELLLYRESIVQPNGEYMLWGEKYPHLLKVWLKRIQHIGLAKAIQYAREEVWPVYAGRVELRIQNHDLEKALAMLDAWSLVAVTGEEIVLKGYALLQLKVSYQQEDVTGIEAYLPLALRDAQGNGQDMAFVARVLMENGRMEDGIQLLSEAVSLDAEAAGLWEELGDALIESQDYEGAIAAYERCFVTLPRRIELLKKMGDCYLEFGQVDAAKLSYEAFKQKMQEQAVTEECLNRAEQAFQDGLRLHGEGHLAEAVKRYEEAIRFSSDNITAWMNLGVALGGLKRYEEAEKAFHEALKRDGKNIDVLYNLGCLYIDAGRINEAKDILEQVIGLDPTHANAHNNLGHIHKEYLKAFQKAIEFFEKALRGYLPNTFDTARAYYNLGNCYQELLEIAKAIDYYKKAIAISPDFVEAHWNLSHVLLLDGKNEEGFREYLWRWRRKEAISQDPVPIPRWQGEPEPGRILVWTEQGAGDNIQFVRYLPLLKAQGKDVVMACDANLAGLFHGMKEIDRMVVKSHMPIICNEMDWHVPLLNLPTLLQKGSEPFPLSGGYLAVDERLFDGFKGIFEPHQKNLKVGFVWKGNPKHNRDRERSVSFELFKPLFALPHIAWFSLQYQNDLLPVIDPKVVNLAPYLFDFAHTAALISHLDLVITVDTSIAHLAGAILPPDGIKRPEVWTLLAYVPDWRWGVNRDTTPWYDNMRLLRQKKRDDWQDVFDSVKEMLRKRMI